MDRSELLAVVRRATPVWVLALLIVGVAELVARSALGDDGRWQYWNRTMATKVNLLERARDNGAPPDVLVLGDSSAAFNIQPPVLDRIAGTQSFNLGSAGNYASSFDVTITQGVLPALGFEPKGLMVSFAGHGFDPEHLGQTRRILSSPLGQRLQGERVWGDTLYLVRAHHLLRLLRDPAVNPSIRRQKGFEPYLDALSRRRRRPGLARRLPPPPAWMVQQTQVQEVLPDDPMAPLRHLFSWAAEHDIGVVLISPPSEQKRWIPALDRVAADFGVPHWDYSAAPFKHHLSHLSVDGARRYSRLLGQRLKDEGWVTPHL